MKKRSKKRELSPLPHMMRSVISRRHTWPEVFAEFIDNSFAINKGGATEVHIKIGTKKVEIWDNGKGTDDINRLFQLGNSSSFHDRSDIGLFGIGATHSIMWMGARCRARSVHIGRMQDHSVDWDDCIERNRYPWSCSGHKPINQPTQAPKQLRWTDGQHGVLLEINLRRDKRPRQGVKALRTRLGRIFAPGLRDGRKIVINGETLVPADPPTLLIKERISGTVYGKKWSGFIGIMDPIESDLTGFHFGFSHRWIEHTKEPMRELTSHSIYGEVHLDADWRESIADHKDAVSRDRQELMDQIYQASCVVLKMAREDSQKERMEDIRLFIQDKIAVEFNENGREKTDGGSSEPGDQSPGPGHGGKSGDPSRSGEAFGNRSEDGSQQAVRNSGIEVEFSSLSPDRAIAFAGNEEHLTITFNLEHEFISSLLDEPPLREMLSLLASMALCIWVAPRNVVNRSTLFGVGGEEFSEDSDQYCGKLVSKIIEANRVLQELVRQRKKHT